MRRKTLAFWMAWIICGVVCALAIYRTGSLLLTFGDSERPFKLLSAVFIDLLPVLFSVPAALVIARQPRNVIGWLLMTPALVGIASDLINQYLLSFPDAAPALPFPILFLMLFGVEGDWIGLIFPLLLIPLYFPTGRLISPRWRWTVYLAGAQLVIFFLWSLFMRRFEPENLPWSLDSPIGFLSEEFANRYIFPSWILLLVILTAASLASIVARYRRAKMVEREQMKWLLFACAVFAAWYIPSLIYNTELLPQPFKDISDMLFMLTIAMIPAAIAIAILRYRLFDIDVVIRLTLVYALVTGLLGLAYLGGVVLLQASLRSLTGQASSLAVVITTLIIAALFNPLRQRIQAVIDRRFYRKKYNADQALAAFAASARNGSDIDTLTEMLEELVQTNLQPSHVHLHLLPNGIRKEE